MNFYLYERDEIVSTICDRKSIRNRGLEYCMVWCEYRCSKGKKIHDVSKTIFEKISPMHIFYTLSCKKKQKESWRLSSQSAMHTKCRLQNLLNLKEQKLKPPEELNP